MASASDPPAHPALQPADQLILPPQQPPAAVETSIGPPHCPAEGTQSDAFVQPSLRARQGHANSDSFDATFKLSGQPVFSPDRYLALTGRYTDHSAMHYTSHQGTYFCASHLTLEG